MRFDVLSRLVAVAMLVPGLAGCGGPEEPATPDDAQEDFQPDTEADPHGAGLGVGMDFGQEEQADEESEQRKGRDPLPTKTYETPDRLPTEEGGPAGGGGSANKDVPPK